MNPHLSGDGVSKWIIGERTAAEEEHVRECPACQAEVARLSNALAEFRRTVYEWGDRLGARQPSRPAVATHRLRWAWVAIILFAALWPLYKHEAARRRAEAARADDILLEQVDAGVSRGIARSMEPLARLMTWEENRKSEENR